MSHTVLFDFKRSPVYKKGEGGRNVYSAIASTDALDRDYEVLIPKGVITENFVKNPVMLYIHQSRQLPVGRVLTLTTDETSVKFTFEFSEDDVGQKVEKMYQTGFMNAFSVGFIPRAYVPVYNLPDEVTSVEVELPDGSKQLVDFTKYEKRPWGVIPQWELLEISPVPVPSNPEALLQRAAETIVRKCVDRGQPKALTDMLQEDLNSQIGDITRRIENFVRGVEVDVTVSGVVPYEPVAGVDDGEFFPIQVLGVLSAACSSDRSGERDTLNWAKFAKAFGWFDVAKADAFTGYKYLHHVMASDQLRLSKSGLFKAMSDLLGADLGADKQGVYDHLAKHYAELGLEPPRWPLEAGLAYTTDQLARVADGHAPDAPADPAPADTGAMATDEPTLATTVLERLTRLESALAELDLGTKVRSQVLVRMLEEINMAVVRLEETSSARGSNSETASSSENAGDVEIVTQLTNLRSLFTTVLA